MTIEKPIPDLKPSDLDLLYKDGEDCDKRLFAEMRTNLQLVAGEHYVREGSRFWNRIRDDKQLTADQRIKLTKNHLQRVTKLYRNAIESYAPDVGFFPANENELQDQKAAELHTAYWQHIKRYEHMPEKIAGWIQNFIEIGEVHTKIFWDRDSGQIIGNEAQVDETGNVVNGPDGQPMQSQNPAYGGRVRFETIEGYNLKRDRDAKSMSESPYVIYGKLIPKKSLRSYFTDEDTIKKFESASSEEYSVYDNNTGTYREIQGQALVKEIYFRPGKAIPKGYYFIYTGTHVLAQGELPYGIFPIISENFDSQSGNARGHSIIRPLRPAQIEVNRCASKIAEHQVTLGDDKVWIPSTGKVSQGATLPGIRVNTYSGMQPIVTEGRTGDQYLPYLNSQIDEIYKLANLEELLQERGDTNSDIYTNLFRSFRLRQKFALYGEKFERFLVKVAETALDIARHCANDHEFIKAVGRNEQINISEFKNADPLACQIKVEPRSDDVDSQFGKQVAIDHILQYVGSSLGKDEIGQMIRLSPFLNKEQMFKRFTQKYDRAVNDILALDRGQFRPAQKYDDHKYIISAITTRMSEPDFESLPVPIQMLYQEKVRVHEEAEALNLQELQRAESGFIPSGGYMVACDFYTNTDANDPNKVKRVRIPSESLSWLIDKLKSQGTETDALAQMPGGVVSDMGKMIQPNNGAMNDISGQSSNIRSY